MTKNLIVEDSTPGARVPALDRPERLNALDRPTPGALNEAVGDCSKNGRDMRDIYFVVIRGKGRGFCSGPDVKWLADGVLADGALHMRYQDRMQQTYESLEAADQILITSVNGLALAGGFESSLSCDIIIADERAGDEHLLKKLLPRGGGSQRLPLGLPRAMYSLVTGRRMCGRYAERTGLVSPAVPGSELHSRTMQLAEEIARIDPDAFASIKFMACRAPELPLKAGLWFERWVQYRFRNEFPSMLASVHEFAERGKTGPAIAGN